MLKEGLQMNEDIQFDLGKWTKLLKKEYEFMSPPREDYQSELKELKKSSPKGNTRRAEFLEIMSKGYPVKRKIRGSLPVSQDFMELIVLGLELAKGNKSLLSDIRAILQSVNSRVVPPNKENSVFVWSQKFQGRDFKFIAKVKSVGTHPDTSWANKMKNYYLDELNKMYHRTSEREKKIDNKEYIGSNFVKVDKQEILKRIKKKWLVKVTKTK